MWERLPEQRQCVAQAKPASRAHSDVGDTGSSRDPPTRRDVAAKRTPVPDAPMGPTTPPRSTGVTPGWRQKGAW